MTRGAGTGYQPADPTPSQPIQPYLQGGRVMSKSSRGFGFGRRSGTVTVIEQKVHRSSERHARLAFVITVLIVGLVTMVVASDKMHPILAALLAAPIAAIAGAFVWLLVRI